MRDDGLEAVGHGYNLLETVFIEVKERERQRQRQSSEATIERQTAEAETGHLLTVTCGAAATKFPELRAEDLGLQNRQITFPSAIA